MSISEVLQNKRSYYYATGDTLEILRQMPEECIDVVVTSPAYYGLQEYGIAEWSGGDPECDHQSGRFSRNGLSKKQASNPGSAGDEAGRECAKCGAVRVDTQFGLELIPDCRGYLTGNPCGECYVCHLVGVFRELRRVLRPDGVVWLNLGDSYATHGAGAAGKELAYLGDTIINRKARSAPPGLKEKDMIGIPWRVAFALQADGWWLRSDTIWAKTTVMPFSGSGWQWEQHMVGVGDNRIPCPGCEKCEPNGGLVLNKGAWRPTNSHEYIFQLTKSPRYFMDPLAVRQLPSEASIKRLRQPGFELQTGEGKGDGAFKSSGRTDRNSRKTLENFAKNPGRNLWDVWVVPTTPLKDEHFAAFPSGLPEIAIRASVSKGGYCEHCHAPYARVVEREAVDVEQDSPLLRVSDGPKAFSEQETTKRTSVSRLRRRAYNIWATGRDRHHDNPFPAQHTLGWKATCACGSTDPVSAVVLDPFSGSGTTVRVANALGVRGIGIDLNPKYNEMAERLIGSVKLIQKESYAGIPDSQLSLF